MMDTHSPFTGSEKKTLLQIARGAIEAVVNNEQPPQLNLEEMPDRLTRIGASFVTITINDRLRGCIGTLEARQPLVIDVQEHALAAATQDHRFPPLKKDEFPHIHIEVSVLTPMKKLDYAHPSVLLNMIRPGNDGVVLINGSRRATFLPQVWEKIPSPEDFLSHLCLKMGDSPDLWRNKKLDVFLYQVEEMEENEFKK